VAEGYRAIEAGDYAAAEAAFRPLAEAGDARAQMALGVVADLRNQPEAAMAWYKRAAEQGLSEAQVLLGAAYLNNGELVAAHCWIARAAERKHLRADALLQSIAARLSPGDLARAQALFETGCP
jgi:TPR repeat protein